MPDALPASQSDEVDPQCNLWIFRALWIQRGAVRNQRAVEHEQRLSRRRIPPKCSGHFPLSLIWRRRKAEPVRQMQSLFHYSSLEGFAACKRPTPNAQLRTLNSVSWTLGVGSWAFDVFFIGRRKSATSALSWRQPEGSDDSLEIVRSVVLDFNPPAFVSVVNRDVRRQMLLQPVL